MEAKALLEKHNPLLVILPNHPGRKRPGAWWKGKGRGDYHPVSAEVFLSLVAQSDKPRPFSWDVLKGWLKTLVNPLSWEIFYSLHPHKTLPPLRRDLALLRARALEFELGATDQWEMDLDAIWSTNPSQAWRVYQAMLAANPEAGRAVVYGRVVETPRRLVLQYWYLYIYNDAPNKHEGDWEMVAIEVDRDTNQPQQVGYSGHSGGARRAWSGVHRNGDRPFVFVARGSHAAYLDHIPKGHRTQSVTFSKNLPLPFELPMSLVQALLSRAIYGLGVRDWTCRIPGSVGQGEEGEILSPELVLLGEIADLREDPARFWMNLDCYWGSGRTRLTGFIAPPPPWRQAQKWHRPLSWIRNLEERLSEGDTQPS
jgi:hypothetical protein